jgi:hypothetical protein
MARRAARVDDNQKSVVDDLRTIGCSIQHLHAQGMGCPDILAGWRGRNFLFEIKDPGKPPSKRGLRTMQQVWQQKWTGQVHVIHSADEAIEIMQREFNEIPIKGVISCADNTEQSPNWQSIGDLARKLAEKSDGDA